MGFEKNSKDVFLKSICFSAINKCFAKVRLVSVDTLKKKFGLKKRRKNRCLTREHEVQRAAFLGRLLLALTTRWRSCSAVGVTLA